MKLIQIPKIIQSNTYFWNGSGNASSRRANEEKKLNEVFLWLNSMGFAVKQSNDSIEGTLGEVEVKFSYSESCKNVYKKFTVYRKNKKSNIKRLIAEMKKVGITLQ